MLVIVIASSVRPWKACSKTTTASRPVACRAILTAFSRASAPLLVSRVFFGARPGAIAFNFSHSATYPSYGETLKHVWVNRSSCSAAARTTSGLVWPTLSVPMPPAKSIRTFPSTSVRRAPRAVSA